MTADYPKFTAAELTDALMDKLIHQAQSFQVVTVSTMASVVEALEGRIEKAGLTCRVYTENRAAAMAGSFFGPTAIAGVAASVAIAAHNLATFDPDYEIGKGYTGHTVTVTCKDPLRVQKKLNRSAAPSAAAGKNTGFEGAVNSIAKAYLKE